MLLVVQANILLLDKVKMLVMIWIKMIQEKNLFVYWIGPKPSLIHVLDDLMRLHSNNGKHYRLHVLGRDDFLNNYPDAPKCFDRLKPAHQADVVRVWALLKHGGIWLDSDTLVMSSLASVFDDVCNDKKGFFVARGNYKIMNSVFGSKRNTRLLRKWKKHILRTLDEFGADVKWSILGQQFLTNAMVKRKELFSDYLIYNGPATMEPVCYTQCVDAFLSKDSCADESSARSFQPLIILSNRLYKALDGNTKSEILQGNTPLSRMIAKSLCSLVSQGEKKPDIAALKYQNSLSCDELLLGLSKNKS